MLDFTQRRRLCYIVALALFALQGQVGAFPQTHTQQVAAAKDPKCLQPMDAGPCRMNLERYYYNAQKNTCETFKFGGCRGNDNKFGFRKTCEDACMKPAMAAATSSLTKPKAVVANKQNEPVVPTTPKTAHSTPTTAKVAVTGPSTGRPTTTTKATPRTTPKTVPIK